jgi:hypothetical protein
VGRELEKGTGLLDATVFINRIPVGFQTLLKSAGCVMLPLRLDPQKTSRERGGSRRLIVSRQFRKIQEDT